MKNIDLNYLAGKNISFAFKEVVILYKKNLKVKIHSYKIFSYLFEQILNEYSSSKFYVLRGIVKEKFSFFDTVGKVEIF